MWYFSWVLGVSFAISFSIINALWLEEKDVADAEHTAIAGERARDAGPATTR